MNPYLTAYIISTFGLIVIFLSVAVYSVFAENEEIPWRTVFYGGAISLVPIVNTVLAVALIWYLADLFQNRRT